MKCKKTGPIAWMASNSVASNLLMLGFIVGGLLAVWPTPQIRQEVFPEFELDIITVSVAYPGASPEEVEQGILLSIEENVRGLDGVKRVTSRASEGSGTVSMELLEDAESNRALQDVKNAVDRITTFPEEAERPIVSLVITRGEVLDLILYGDVDEAVLRELVEMAKDELTSRPDVTLAETMGTRPLEISIEVSQGQLRAHDLTLGRIATEVAAATVEISGGGVKTDGGEILLRTAERRDFGIEYEGIPVVSTSDGVKLRVCDIATVKDGFEDIDQAMSFNGHRAAGMTVYQVGDEDPVGVSSAVIEYAEDLQSRLPPGIQVATVADRSEIYRDRLHLLVRNAGLGLVLVMIILGLFLEVRLAFWVMLGIPTSFLGALLFLPYMDVSVNMVSLFAFIIAVGIVVDDAIVVGENIHHARQLIKSRGDAAIAGAQIVAVPVVFSILTNIMAFLPLLFVPGVMGKIWRNIPIVIIIVFLISLVEALLILPAHLGHQKPRKKNWFWNTVEAPQEFFGKYLQIFINRIYNPFVKFTLRHRYSSFAIALAVLIVVIGFVKSGRLDFTFFPKVESDRIRASAVLPYGSPVEDSEEVKTHLVEVATEILEEHGGAEVTRGVVAQVGSSMSGGGGPHTRSTSSGSHLTSVTVHLVPLGDRDFTAAEFTSEWRKRIGRIAGLESLTFKFSIGPGGGDAIDVELSHPDTETLETAAASLAASLQEFEGVVEIDDGIARGKPQWDFTLKPAARSLGVTASDLARQVRHAFYGAEVKRQQRGQDEVKIYVRLPDAERQTEYDVERLLIRTPKGGEIPLNEAAEVARGRAYEEIKRTEGRRVLNVTADVKAGVANAEKVLASLRMGALEDLKTSYPGLTYSLEGEQRDRRESMGSLLSGFILALLGLYALLAIPFKSYIQPLIIMMAIPFGIIGAVVGHIIMGFELSIVSMMGMVALTGVVINDNILLIDTINIHRREGKKPIECAAMAPTRRFRPVLLTSVTTFCGLAPIMLEKSMQARFLIPMAISLGFGILFSTLITLILTPSLYMIVEDVKRAGKATYRFIWGEPERVE